MRSDAPSAIDIRKPLGRLLRRADFLFVRDGFRGTATGVVIQGRRRGDSADGAVRYGLTATKKLGNAVVRNRVRRRLRAAAERFLPELALGGVDYVLIGRDATAERTWTDLVDDVETALKKLHRALNAAAALSARDQAASGATTTETIHKD
jgi:ribonuclease P protein component